MAITISCNFHPKYRAIRRPTAPCETCKLLFIFRWQLSDEAEEHLGGLNPCQFVDVQDGCENIKGNDQQER